MPASLPKKAALKRWIAGKDTRVSTLSISSEGTLCDGKNTGISHEPVDELNECSGRVDFRPV